MTDRPRIAVIGYGSILNADDLGELFTDVEERAVPIKVSGFERTFNQEASWRETNGDERAVLNVVRSEGDWFNGVLVCDLGRSEFTEFRRRERGYRLIEVEADEIDPYDPDDEPVVRDHDLILVTTGKKVRDDIAPIESYVELCLDGAEEWGQTFLEDFERTTTLSTGATLRTEEWRRYAEDE